MDAYGTMQKRSCSCRSRSRIRIQGNERLSLHGGPKLHKVYMNMSFAICLFAARVNAVSISLSIACFCQKPVQSSPKCTSITIIAGGAMLVSR